ncbi:MAG: CHAT domain-containing protein [bacterium]|nr:CHAT domain-containing protein [bacterium]
MRLVPVLWVEAVGGSLRWRLDIPEHDLGEPLHEEVRQPCDEATLRALVDGAAELLHGAEHAGFAREAQARGAVLYRTLVPERLRPKLRALAGRPLLVSTSLTGLPWELLHDDEEFWGLRYGLGKRLLLDRPVAALGSAGPAGARPRALVIASDPRGDLPFVRREADAICEALEARCDVVCIADRLATFDAVSAYLGEGFSLIHWAGHVVADAAGTPGLLLADERVLSPHVVESNLAGRPLVFLNGCASARGASTGGEGDGGAWEATVSSVANGFLFGGALGVVGTLCEVSDRHAAPLAERFYAQVLGGATLGESLRHARAGCRADVDCERSPSWLSFVLYGNPGQRLLAPPDDETPAALPVVVEAPTPGALPARGAGASALRDRRRWLTFLLLVIAIAGGVLWRHRVRPASPLVIGVMEVKARGAAPAWMRELTRDGLITILSKFPPMQVVSRQKIDFVRTKRQIGELEAAEALGMTRLLSATVSVDASLVTLDLEVIDPASGILVASERVQGPESELMHLEAEFALQALRALGLSPTAEQVQAALATRGPETLRAYRLLSETLGEPTPPSGGTSGTTPPPTPDRPAPDTSWLFDGGVAFAQAPDDDESAIRTLLGRYAEALQAKSVERLAALQLTMSDAQRASLDRYFANAGDLAVRIDDVDVLVEGDEALATFTRLDAFTDGGTGRTMRLEVRITGTLVKNAGAWKIRGLREPS